MGIGYAGKKYKFKLVDLTDNTQVNSGGATNTQALRPADGKIYEVVHMYVYIPDAVGSTAGTHKIECAYNDESDASGNFLIQGNTGTAYIGITCAGFVGDAEQPAGLPTQFDRIKSLTASYDYYINFKYTNSLDANQTGTRRIEIWVKEFDEVI